MNKSIGHVLKRHFKKPQAFTIVELLVVIVVIGILAAITIVSYSGITNKAITASIKNDLDNNLKLLKMYNVDHGYYPSSLDTNNCPLTPDTDNRYCLKSMRDATLEYTGGNQSFELIDTHNPTGIAYQINEGGSLIPVAVWRANEISNGGNHTCATNKNGQVYCWGYNPYGQLGDNSIIDKNMPTLINQGALGVLTVNEISAGYYYTCVIASDSHPYCWGYNANGGLGNNSTIDSHIPVATSQGDMPSLNIKQISVGKYHTCAIASNDQAYCWGYNNWGALGNGNTADRHVPTTVLQGAMPSLTVKKIITGDYHTCAIASNDQVYCWGQDTYSQLGDGGTTTRTSPVAVSQGTRPTLNVRQIFSGEENSCAIADDDHVYCWGSGPLGNGNGNIASTPVTVLQGAMPSLFVKDIAIGINHTCMIAVNDQLYCWGSNANGELGINNTTTNLIPVAVLQGAMPSLMVKSVSARLSQTCAVAMDNKIYCWGANSNGQLGDSSVINRLTPTKSLTP